MTQAIKFDADKRREQRETGSKITIGGKVFKPAPKTPERMERYFDQLPEVTYTTEELQGDIAKLKEFQKLDAHTTYAQLSIILFDEEGAEADVAFLKSELVEDDADDLLALLMPSRSERERRGNSNGAEAETA